MLRLRPLPVGEHSRFFPSKREFRRFSPANRQFIVKTPKQIKLLPANSRSTVNREFTPA
jgi:hypothetical protein